MPGDWSGRGKWQDELDKLPQEMRKEGFIPGIWIAPTAIHESHPIVKEHPEWLQRDTKGELCITFHNWKRFNGMTEGKTYFLEPDHPGARAFLLKTLRDLRAKGWDYFKIDFADQWDDAATAAVKRYWNKAGPVVPAAQHLFLRPDGLPAALSVAYGPGDYAVGIYNWDTAPKDITVSLADLRLPSADYQTSPADHGQEKVQMKDGAITIKAQPGESLRIIRLRARP
jgi:hypothetical protein